MSLLSAYHAVQRQIAAHAQLGAEVGGDVEALIALLGGRAIGRDGEARVLQLLRGRGEAGLAEQLASALRRGGAIPPELDRALKAFVEGEMLHLADWSAKVGEQEKMHQTLLIPVKKVMDQNDQAVSGVVRNLIA